MPPPLRILFVTSECAPWIKTGGLADVSAALPPALEACGAEVRVLMPAYGALQGRLPHSRKLSSLAAHGPLPRARDLGGQDAATVMTIHNLAFQGIFPRALLAPLGLPPESWSIAGVEYFGQLSFLKAGLYYADALTTVSPTYAEEIQREPLGMGLQGLLAGRRDVLTGILNGIDVAAWDPSHDPHLAHRFDATRLGGKAVNKRALQRRAGLPEKAEAPLCAMVSRLTEQKGVDLVLGAAPALLAAGAQLVVLGTGDRAFEQALTALAAAHPAQASVTIGFDEAYAHLVEAGADLFLMPSRFEPCGMNQMYSQRYGTVPIVHGTGGLLDSVVDCSPATLADGSASGFVFRAPTIEAFATALDRALAAYRAPRTWRALQRHGMARDFSWTASAGRYLEIYERLAAAQGR